MEVSSLTGSYSTIGRKMEMRSSSSLSSIISLPLQHSRNMEKFALHAMIIAPRKFTPPLLQQSENLELEKFSLLHPIMISPRKSTLLLSRCIKNNTAVVTSESWDDMVLESDIPVVIVFCCNWCLFCKVTRYRNVSWGELVYKSNVLMSFYGRWCVHTRMAHRFINELAEDYIGRVNFFVIDIDKYPGIAKKYGVLKTLPAVVVFKDGEKRDVVSWMSRDELYDAIERVLAL